MSTGRPRASPQNRAAAWMASVRQSMMMALRRERCMASSVRPVRRVLRPAVALDAHDAEPLAGRRFHHGPALQLLEHLRAEPLEARDLGGDVVGLDIDVHA